MDCSLSRRSCHIQRVTHQGNLSRRGVVRCVNWLLPQSWSRLPNTGNMFESYRDRREAGQYLGQELQRQLPSLLANTVQQRHQEPVEQQQAEASSAAGIDTSAIVVLGLVRGGMPVADAVAQALHCNCDAFVVRKVGAPLQPEFGIGAIAEGGHVIINEAAVESVGATQDELQDIISYETRELQRRVQAYRGGQPHLPVQGKAAILVDDGLATGVTARAACTAIRAAGAARVVLAVPVGSAHTVSELQQEGIADVVVCLRTPQRFRAVGAHYLDFSQTTDEEVVAILRRYPHTATAPVAQHAPQHTTTSAKGATRDASAGSSTDTAAARDQAQQGHQGHAAGAASARTSSLSTALHPSPAAAAAAAAEGPHGAGGTGGATAQPSRLRPVADEQIVITDGESGVQLHGSLTVPEGACGLVVFAHGSGSSRLSPRNRQVAATLNESGLATLLFDLLSPEEAAHRHNVFDISLLASRLQLAVEWLEAEGAPGAGKLPGGLPLGFFGASTGGGAALWAAAYLGPRVSAVVVRGGRPDLAAPKLPAVTAPTLLLVGGEDTQVLQLNNEAIEMMGSSDSSQIVVVPGAGHLFEGPGQLEEVADQAVLWFRSHMGAVPDDAE